MIIYCKNCFEPGLIPTNLETSNVSLRCPACQSVWSYSGARSGEFLPELPFFCLQSDPTLAAKSAGFTSELEFLDDAEFVGEAIEIEDYADENVIADESGEFAPSGNSDFENDPAIGESSEEADELQLQPVALERPVQRFDFDVQPINAKKRRTKSPLFGFLQVILGGFASIPIATLIIWFGLGKDPFKWGPIVAEYAPWIVPVNLQGGSSNMGRSLANKTDRVRTQSDLPDIGQSPANERLNAYVPEDSSEVVQSTAKPNNSDSILTSDLPLPSQLGVTSPDEIAIPTSTEPDLGMESTPAAPIFGLDKPRQAVPPELLLASTAAEASIAALIETDEPAALDKVYLDLQAFTDQLSSVSQDSTLMIAPTERLEAALTQLTGSNALKTVVNASAKRVEDGPLPSGSAYLDIIELDRIIPDDQPSDALVANQRVELFATARTPDRVRQLIIKAPAKLEILSQTVDGKPSRYLLFGRMSDADEATFEVILAIPL